MFLLASNSKSEALFKVTPDTDTHVHTLSHLVKISTAFVKLEYSLLDSQNTTSGSCTESDVSTFVQNTSTFSLKLTSNSLTNSMEEIPSLKADRFSASQEISCILWNPKYQYLIYKCPPPVTIVSQLDSFHAPRSHLLKIHFIISPLLSPCLPIDQNDINLSKIITNLEKLYFHVSRAGMMLCSLLGVYRLHICLSSGVKCASELKMVAIYFSEILIPTH